MVFQKVCDLLLFPSPKASETSVIPPHIILHTSQTKLPVESSPDDSAGSLNIVNLSRQGRGFLISSNMNHEMVQ